MNELEEHSFDFVKWVFFDFYQHPTAIRKDKTLSGIWIWFNPNSTNINDDFYLTPILYDKWPNKSFDLKLKKTAINFLEFLSDNRIILYRRKTNEKITDNWILLNKRKKSASSTEIWEMFNK